VHPSSVFNANLQKGLFNAHRFYDVAEMKRRLANPLYNRNETEFTRTPDLCLEVVR
jgi:hypothetical protein